MPRIQCPSCQNWLKLPREVHNAKLRCSKCGNVFTGSSQEEAPPAAPASGDPAAASSKARPAAPKAARPDAPKQKAAAQSAEGGVKVVTVFTRKKSNAPAIIAVLAALLLIPILALAIFGLTHKHLILTDPKGTVVLDKWLSNDEATVAAEEHKKKYDPKAKEPSATPVAGGEKTTSSPARTGNVSEGGAVGVAKILGDSKLTIENLKYDADQTNIIYTGVVRSRYDKPIEAVEMTLRFDRTPSSKAMLQWIAPNGCVPFTVTFNGITEADAKTKAPDGVFGEPKVRKDMGGYDIPFSEVGSPGDDPKTITLEGNTTNHTTTALRDAKMYVDFAGSDKGVVQEKGQCVPGELKSTDLMPEGKVGYKVTWDVFMQGVPLKYYVRVIGAAN